MGWVNEGRQDSGFGLVTVLKTWGKNEIEDVEVGSTSGKKEEQDSGGEQ